MSSFTGQLITCEMGITWVQILLCSKGFSSAAYAQRIDEDQLIKNLSGMELILKILFILSN
ncbi:MAG: hypothetical protein ONB05_02760 [candidate division KSB1 bacterium]|nr:hypothetical protein [candidate division KSB1 bacterium]